MKDAYSYKDKIIFFFHLTLICFKIRVSQNSSANFLILKLKEKGTDTIYVSIYLEFFLKEKGMIFQKFLPNNLLEKVATTLRSALPEQTRFII